MLDMIFRKQTALQQKTYGITPAELDPEQRARYIVEMVTALNDELHEALAETGWKSWASSRHFNRDAYLNELVDALHFLVNLMLVADTDAYEIIELYERKNRVNRKRQQNGYTGVNEKCATCHRALDDTNVHCTKEQCAK